MPYAWRYRLLCKPLTDTDLWSGELYSFRLDEDSDGLKPTASENWKASEEIPVHGDRKIFTRKYDQNDTTDDASDDTHSAVSFDTASLDDTAANLFQ